MDAALIGLDQYQAIFRTQPVPCLLLAPDLTIVDATDAYLATTMTTRATLIGRDLFDVFTDDPSVGSGGVDNLRASLHRVLASRKADVMALQRYDISRPEGGFEERYWSPVNVPVLDEAGEVRWIIHKVVDVTEYLWACGPREPVAGRLDAMEAEVYRSSQELRQARDEAAQASQAKTQFLAAVSHDLRQPVQAMTLFMQLLRSQALTDEAQRFIGFLDKSVEALREMLDGLLDLARLDAGMVKPDMHPFRVDLLLADIAAEFRPAAEAKGLSLEVWAPDLGALSDPLLLAQVLRNLISNALKYTPTGRVRVFAIPDRDGVAVGVADTGIGIAEDQLGKIFADFYQVDNPTRDRARGLGIGLGTVARTVRLLGHVVEVRSKPGEGAEFVVRLPAAESGLAGEDGGHPGRHAIAERSLAGRTVLLVEDEASVAAAMTQVMECWGMQVAVAESVEEVGQLLAAGGKPPDIVVSDYLLPGGRTGREAIGLVRRCRDVPAIILTGDTAPDRLMEARASGLRLLHKPVGAAELHQAILEEL